MDRAEKREARRIYLLAKARQILDDHEHVACSSRLGSRDEDKPIQRSPSWASLSTSSVSSCVSHHVASPELGSVPPHLVSRVAQGLPLPSVKIGLRPSKQVSSLIEKMWHRLHSPQLKQSMVQSQQAGVVSKVVRSLNDDVFWDLMGYLSAEDVAI